MKKCLTGILLGLALLLSMSGIKGTGMQGLQAESLLTDCRQLEEGSCCVGIEENAVLHDPFSLDAFYLSMCEVPAVMSLTPRGGGFTRLLRGLSTIRVLAFLNTPLVEKSSKDQYFHSNFVKVSYRYYVYTLRRLLI